MKRFIPVANPVLNGNEKKYVLDCLESTWISSSGKYVKRFEEGFANYCCVKHALSCCNGTVALHLALLALGVGPEDEVIVPTLTFVATTNAVSYCGARPVFIDVDQETWNIDPALIEEKITTRTKGIIAVHLYGHPVDMDPIISIAFNHNLFVIEDAAEAHGAKYKGRMIGSISDIATFSFYGNKIITTGEGGMVVTSDDTLANKINQLKESGMDPDKRYWFPTIGYNYRMTNVAAAIGLAQLEKIDEHIKQYRKVAGWYYEYLQNIPALTLPVEREWARNVYWMFTIILSDNIALTRDEIMTYLKENGIDTRPVFYLMSDLPPYRDFSNSESFPIATRLAQRSISLPTSAVLT